MINQHLGKFFITIGIFTILIGLIFIFKDKVPLIKNLGNLPGDIIIKKENFQFYFPIVTCLIISILINLIYYFLNKIIDASK